jgi:hypothetical protein
MGDTPKPIEKMLVTDLRAELQKRGLETKGLKKELFDRLKAAMDAEAAGGNSDAPSNVDYQNQPEKNAENKEEQSLDVETSDNKSEQMEIPNDKKRKREEEDVAPTEKIEIESERSEKEATPQAKRRKTAQDEENIEVESKSTEQPSSIVTEAKDEKSVNIDETSRSETSAKPAEAKQITEGEKTESSSNTAPAEGTQNQTGANRLRKSGTPAGRNTLRTETGLLFQLPDKSKTGNTSTSANNNTEKNTTQKKDVKQDEKPRVSTVGGVKIVPPSRTIVIEPPTKAVIIPPSRREVIIEPPTKKTIIVDGDMPRVIVNLGSLHKMTRSVVVHDQTDDEIGDLNKSRRVPKSARPATKSLNIRNFVKPFDELEARRFLEKFGELDYFWLEGSQCFVTYSSIEEATEAREGTYNLIWPVHPKAKPLIAEFVTEKDAKDHLNRRQEYIKQRREGDTSEKNNKDDVESSEEEEAIALEEIFKLTKAKPPIYWLPLTDEEVKVKKARRN